MKIIEKVLTDAIILKSDKYLDNRGYFTETFRRCTFREITGIDYQPVQENESLSKKNVLRAIHFQKGQFSQAKLVRVVQGRVLDIAVDLRPNSPTFKSYHFVELSEKNSLQFFIPKGFGHGFLSLEDNSKVQYKVDNIYNKESEAGIIWNDSVLDIEWPKMDYIISHRDQNLDNFIKINFEEIWQK